MDKEVEPHDYIDTHEKIFRDMEDLERRGKLNYEEPRYIDERIKSATELQKKEIDRRIDELRDRFSKQQTKTTPSQRIALYTIYAVIIGLGLEMTLGRGFIFAKADEYRSVATWIFVGLLPLSATVIYRLPLRDRLSNSFLTKWIMVPLGALMVSGFVALAPLGWIALGGMILPAQHVELPATVVSVRHLSRSAGSCDQRATLLVAWGRADICLENRVVGKPLMANDAVVLRGDLSALGIYIDEIELTDKHR